MREDGPIEPAFAVGRKSRPAKMNRNKIVRNTSVLGIVANLLIAGVKVVLGVLTSSVAIVSVGEAYGVLHALQLAIMREEKVTMVFGVYAVDRDHEDSKVVRTAVLDFVRRREHVKSFHAIYLEPGTGRIYCDLVVDYALRDWEPLREEFVGYMKNAFPKNDVVLTIETEFV